MQGVLLAAGKGKRLQPLTLERSKAMAPVVGKPLAGRVAELLVAQEIDELIVVAGSYNYTQPANEFNDENIFVMGSTHPEVEGVDVQANPCKALAVYMKQEIQRIISLSDPYDPSS